MAKYAEYRAYGCNTISREDVLAKFDDAEQRDEFVERINSRVGYGFGEWVPVTVREVSHAYNFRHFTHDASGMFSEELRGERQKNGHAIICISHRPWYVF